MKKSIIVTLSIFLSISLNAQITFEHTYPLGSSFQLVNLSNSGYKYCLIDSVAPNTVKIYNMNHTIWKTINLNVPNGYKAAGFSNVSETLFNSDGLVEVAYIYIKTTAPIDYGGKITNESGTDIFTYPNHAYVFFWFVSAGSNGAKMLVYNRASSTSSYTNFDIYSLPGQLMTKITDNTDDNIEINSFPNPTFNSMTITYDIPDGNYDGELLIYNISGVEVQRYHVDKNFNDILINPLELPAGTYLYKVIAGKFESQTKKFVIE